MFEKKLVLHSPLSIFISKITTLNGVCINDFYGFFIENIGWLSLIIGHWWLGKSSCLRLNDIMTFEQMLDFLNNLYEKYSNNSYC